MICTMASACLAEHPPVPPAFKKKGCMMSKALSLKKNAPETVFVHWVRVVLVRKWIHAW